MMNWWTGLLDRQTDLCIGGVVVWQTGGFIYHGVELEARCRKPFSSLPVFPILISASNLSVLIGSSSCQDFVCLFNTLSALSKYAHSAAIVRIVGDWRRVSARQCRGSRRGECSSRRRSCVGRCRFQCECCGGGLRRHECRCG